MSRVSKNPIQIPANVEIKHSYSEISIKGPLGILKQSITPDIQIDFKEGVLQVSVTNDSKRANEISGTIRALLANMVHGVTVGFEKKLVLVGVGFRAQSKPNILNLMLGYSHPIDHKIPKGISIDTPTQTEVVVKGIDKQMVGQTAAEIRAYRKPEPYKGKGIRYSDEVIVLKEAKKK